MPQKSADEMLIHSGLWSQIKRFLVFQLKLYADATRDLFLSFFAIFAFLADVIFQLKGEDSLFEGLLGIGRRTERAINLFNQYDETEQGIDSIDGIVRKVEDRLRKSEE
ncbi:MAG: hypothetical protein MI746_15245 [Pseudomonadales bacterium]|nr:hypothetical protein [Pseudomonadales bacterium]